MTYATETNSLLQALKRELRRQNITYKAIASKLDLSETSIKRIFSGKNITLERLESLCQIAQTDIAGLVKLAEQDRENSDQLSCDQEQAIIADIRLVLVLVCIVNHWQFHEILEKYDFKETELFRYFAQLDKLNIIELLPANRYRLKLSRQFSWQASGPIQKFFTESVLQEFLKPSLDDSSNHLKFVWGMLTPESANELNRRIQRIVEEFLKMAEFDTRTSVHKKMTSSLLVLFREDWEPVEFKCRQKDGYQKEYR